jgi:hypothetical protein
MECCCWSITTCAHFPSLAKLYCLSSTRPHNLRIFKAFPYMFFLLEHPSEFWKFPISNSGYGKNVIFRMVSCANCSTRNFYCVFTVGSVACHTVSKSLIKDSPPLGSRDQNSDHMAFLHQSLCFELLQSNPNCLLFNEWQTKRTEASLIV